MRDDGWRLINVKYDVLPQAVRDDVYRLTKAKCIVVPQALQDDRFPANTTILVRLTMTNVTS